MRDRETEREVKRERARERERDDPRRGVWGVNQELLTHEDLRESRGPGSGRQAEITGDEASVYFQRLEHSVSTD